MIPPGWQNFGFRRDGYKVLDDVISVIENQVTNDFLEQDIRTSFHNLAEITTDDLLANIFGKFCIGK